MTHMTDNNPLLKYINGGSATKPNSGAGNGNTHSNANSNKTSSSNPLMQYIAPKQDTSGLQQWGDKVHSLLTNSEKHYSEWRGKDDRTYEVYDRLAGRYLNEAESWKSSFADDSEALNFINQYVESLGGFKKYSTDMQNFYSQFEDEDSYKAWQYDYDLKQKYKGMSHTDLRFAMGKMNPEDEEYKWLEEYSRSYDVLTLEDYEKLLNAANAKLEDWEKSGDYVDFTSSSERKAYDAQLADIEAEIESLKDGQWLKTKEAEYGAYPQKADFKAKSTAYDNSIEDAAYRYINDLDNFRTGYDAGMEGSVNTFDKYKLMSDEQIGVYNYLYNTEGKEAADDYLSVLDYELDEKALLEKQNQAAEYAKEHPVLASLDSVPSSLMGGMGIVDVAGQNISRALSGEYKPINYNTRFMEPSAISSTERGAVSQTLIDNYGTIQLDETEHPTLSRILNGKSWADVYQLGMSMADSTAVAMLSPVLGKAGTLLLGGNAGTQGMLEALERGATDEQALYMGLLSGGFETLFEEISLDNLINGDTRSLVKAILTQGFVEGTEELNTSLANNIADMVIMADKSGYQLAVDSYIESGMSPDKAEKRAFHDKLIEMAWDFVGGMASGGIMGGGHGAFDRITGKVNARAEYDERVRKMYGGDASALVTEALELDPDSKFANKLQRRLDSGKDVGGKQITKLVEQNEKAIKRNYAIERLEALGELGDIRAVADAIVKKLDGERLNAVEQRQINQMQARRVLREMADGKWQDGAAEAVEALAESPIEENKPITAEKYTQVLRNAEAIPEAQEEEAVQETQAVAEESSVTIEEASKKYGAQAGAMLHTYNSGQDVAQYDAAYQRAYDMGKSGVSLDYVKKSSGTAYLTETQRELAYEAGKAAADTAAKGKDAANKKGANGKTGRKKGVVSGEGVTGSDLQAAFGMNATQSRAYNILTRIAELTGIDIVLYKSEPDSKGNLRAPEHGNAYGEYRRREPGKLYIDINAGLTSIKGADQLSKYTMLRTFSHEFVHFVENWNPIQYNELRRVVFDTITENGHDVEALIDAKVMDGLDYDAASREVVAEGLTDILPDSNFIQELAEKHKTIFDKLLEKLKEFIADIKAYFDGIVDNQSKEALALKGALGYAENIVKLFDEAAVQAVENYQATVATEAAVETKAETKVEAKTEPKITTSENGYTITDNSEYNSIEITFNEKPSAAIRDVLKSSKFRWNGKKGVWYGKLSHEAAQKVLDAAYEAEKAPAESKPFSGTEIFNDKAIKDIAESKAKGETSPAADIIEKMPVAQSVADKITPKYEVGGYLIVSDGTIGKITRAYDGGGEVWYDAVADNGNEFSVPEKSTQDYSAQMADINGFIDSLPTETHKTRARKYFADRNNYKQLKALADNANTYVDAKTIEKKFGPNTKNVTEYRVYGVVADNLGAYQNLTKLEYDFYNYLRGGKTYGENADNNGAVRQPDSDRQGGPQILEGPQTEDVSGDAQGRDSLGDLEERGRETVRDGLRADTAGTQAERNDGDSQSSDIRRADGLSQEETAAKVEELQEAVEEQIEQQSTELPKGRNFVIDESLNLPSGAKSRFRANVDAIRLIKQLETEGRYATTAEQEILSKYVGWGGLSEAFGELTFNRQTRKSEMAPKTGWEKEFAELRQLVTDGVITEEEYQAASKSTQNAHYTSVEVIKAMYEGLAQLGFKGGRMLEPSSGVGNFVGGMPANMSSQVQSWTMVELDRITGQIAKYLYPNSDVRIQGFEKANIPDNFMDVAIGNVPFGNYGVVDKAYPKRITGSIHNYFFAKSLDKVRPGGVVMFITSSFTMNGRDSSIRQYIMDRADLLGAIRLPNTAFAGNAGTQVVTDILILKKRAPGTEYSGEAFLDSPYTNVSGYQGDYINEYFTNHPEMVLGTPAFARGMYGANSLTYNPFTDKGSLGEQIKDAFTHIKGKMDYQAKQSPEKANFAVERATKKTKNGGYVAHTDGSISRNEDGKLIKLDVDAKTAKRIAGLISIRDSYRKLANYLQQGQDAKFIKQARKELNTAYDNFVKEHGFINSPANRKAIADDPDCFAIYALENYDAEKKTATKADIFSKDTISPNKTITHVEDIQSGIIVSVNQTGRVDAALIAKLTGKTTEAVTRELIDGRMAFKTRDGSLETPEKYLSGNVRAKLREAEGLAPIDKDFANNVEELKKVIPADIPYHDIYVTPGAPWIPTNVYADFIAEMLGGYNSESSYRGPDVVVGKSNQGDFKIVVNNARLKQSHLNTQKWGTNRRSFLDLIDAMMASRSITVKDTIEDPLTGQKRSVVNKVDTAAAQEKVDEITKEFQDWLWRDENRRGELATLYNEVFNALVTPKYDGSSLTVNGQNPQFSLRQHQADAVQRIISSGGNTLLAHKVGAGKTLEMAAAAMKLRELGLVKKPLFVVPKPLVAQWGVEFMNYYPAAKLLVSDDKSFTKANRKTFTNRIANGDYDAVIISYEQFEKIPMSADFQQQFYQEQIDEILDAIAEERAETKGKGITVKEMEKKKAQLEKKIAELTTKAKDEDNADFEQLGVDSIFVDEAHNFKNLQYVSRMNNISGLSNKDGSQRAFDLYTKVRYLQKLNGGRGIVFATATPVMNSMAEMYIMQKYLQSDMLEQLGLKSFDAWAKQFGEVVNSVEIKPSGQGFRVKQTFSNFRNLNELQMLFRSFSDVLTKVPGLKIPKLKGGGVKVEVCEPGQFQKDYMAELEKRADNVKSVDPSVDNMLKITSDGRKVSYTQRMIDPTLPYEPGCKIYRCCENVLTEYKDSKKIKGTQIIFCDMATPKGKSKTTSATENTDEAEFDVESAKLYDDMRAYLVQKGIPAKEIAFIHEADTDQKKKKLFADVNDGNVRVLIGSTGKMGVGMNAQKRIVAIHHLDAPWRPGDVEQRDGRAFRQGNMNDEVTKYTYVTEGSFDARLWDILDRKQHFINQIMNGEDVGRTAEDTGDVTLSAAEVKALASGNPLIEEHVKLTTELQKLENLQQAHKSNVTRARAKLADDEKNISALTVRNANLKEDIKARKDTYSEGKFSMTIGSHKYTDKKDAGVALIAEIKAKASEDGYTAIGSFAGFELRVIKQGHEYSGLLFGKQGYTFNVYVGNTTYGINHLISIAEGLDGRLEDNQVRLKELTADRDAQQQILAEPFSKQAELDQKRARFNEIMEILNPKEEQTIADDDTVQHQARKYLDEAVDNFDGGIYSNVKLSGAEFTRFQSEAMTWHADKVGKVIHQTIGGNTYVYSFDADHNITIYNKYRATNIHERQSVIDDKRNRRTTDRDNDRSRGGGQFDTPDLFSSDRGAAGRSSELSGASLSDSRGSDGGRNAENAFDSDTEQHQQRSESLTDRDILAMAAREIKVDNLSAGEQDALRIFKERLDRLESLQVERAEQGRLYKEQQFGTKVDREAAKATLNRMHVLDEQISRASAEVLSVEDKQVLKRVLQKAKTVVEQQRDQHWQERLKRYRDRRDNAVAIKKYRQRIKGDVDELSNWILHPNNKDVVKHVPDALKNSVIPFISSINFMSKRSLAGGDSTVADKAFLKQLNSLKSALKQNIDVEGMYSGYNDLPADFMENLQRFIDTAQILAENNRGEFIINQMTAEELRELSKVVRTLKKYIMQVNRFHANAMYQHVYEAGDNSIEFMGELRNAGNTGTVSNFMLWQQMRPAYAFERFGDGGMAIYDGLRRGQATLAFNTKKITEFAEAAYTAAEVKAWEDEVKTIRLGPAKSVTMKVSQIMSLYELNKRDQAKGHILGKGIRVATFKDGKMKISDEGHTITPGELNLILKELTPRQKEVADKLQQFMAKQGGEWGNHVSVARWGEELFGEEHYFPINSDGRHLQSTADENPSAASLYALLNMSFTKELQEGANNRIILYSIFDVFANHMASMAQYNAFALPVLDALKWFNYQQKSEADEHGRREVIGSVREQMAKKYGVPEETRPGSGRQGYAESFVINIIKAFNGTEAQGIPADETGMSALRQYNMAQVAYNFRVVVQQPLAITRAALLLDYSSIMRGIRLSPAAIKANIEEMQKYSGIAAWKSLGFYDINISRGLTDLIKHDTDWRDKVSDIGMWGAEKMDVLTWAGIWSACKEQVIKKQGLKPNSEGFYEAVTQLFEDVVYKTQVVDSVLTKNEYLRSKGFFTRAMASFMSEPTTTASMLVDAYNKYAMDKQRGMTKQQAWQKNRSMIVRVAYVYGIGAVVLAAAQAVADAFRDDDDYQTFFEKWLEAFGGNLIDELMPFNKLPILSDFYDLIKELLSIVGVDTYGNPPQSVFMQWYDTLISGTEILYDKISGEDTNYTWYGGAYKLLQAASGMTGLPMAAATRELVTAWNNTVGAMAPSLKVKTYEPSETAQIKYAYQDGWLTEDEAVEQLIRRGLVDNENEAYWTMREWETGDDFSRYDAIYEAVRNGGDFNSAMDELTSHGYKEKDVISNVKGQIGEWYREGEITKQQAVSMLGKYADMGTEEVTKTINKWSAEVVTGIAYDDIKQNYLDGKITESRAIEMRMKYGGYDKESAEDTLKEWNFEKKYGFAYSDRAELYADGKVSRDKLITAIMDYKGMKEAEAVAAVDYLEFQIEYPQYEKLSQANFKAYTVGIDYYGGKSPKDAGISMEVYAEYYISEQGIKGIDADGDGETDRNSRKNQILPLIDSLPLTNAQKDILYLQQWSKNGIRNAPWH